MLLIIYSLIIALGLFLIWPRGSRIFELVSVITISIMVGICTTHADYYSYLSVYDSARFIDVLDSARPGWIFLNAAWHALGIPYSVFISVNTFLFTYSMVSALHKITKNTPFFIALLLIYPGVMNLVQIRQYFAMCLLVIGFIYLIAEEYVGILKYYVILILASSIHSSALIFIIIPLAPFIRSNRRIYSVFILVLLLTCFLTDAPVLLAQRLFDDEVSQAYFAGYGGRTNDLSRIFTVFEMIGAYILVSVSNKVIYKINDRRDSILLLNRAFSYLRFISILFIAIIPVLILNTDFLRLHRFVILLICTVIAFALEVLQHDSFPRIFLKIITCTFLAIMFYGLVWLQAAETVVLPMLGL